MKIIIGLGNPGLRYKNTRHNVGFLTIDALAKKYRVPVKKKGYSGVYGVGRVLGEEVLLLKPLTFMNLSGDAVKAVFSSFAEEKEELLVISDDTSLPLGKLRVRDKGSCGGHNGLSSIIEKIGSDFTRLRVGVNSLDTDIQDMSSYVLGQFRRSERVILKEVLEDVCECIETWLTKGSLEAMNRFN